MDGVLWWLLMAAVSGSWLVMLALVLSLAAWAMFPVAICEGWFYQSRDRNRVLVLGTASVLAAKTAGRLIDDPARRDWQRWCSALWAGLVILSAVGLAGMKLLLTDLGDRVTQWEGQKAVAEYVGVFHEKVYPYKNLLVRGNEVIYEWWD